MGRINFEKQVTGLKFNNPFKEFREDFIQLEVRKDPLLGDTSIYNPDLKDKAKAFFGENDPDLIRNLVSASEQTCIFCGDKPEKNTPKYPSNILSEGRLKIGEAVLFANLFPLGQYHPVVSLTKSHFLKLSEFRPEILSDGFGAARTFLNAVYKTDSEAAFASVNANYLFPAGASLVHPHMQMLVTPVAYSYQARLNNAARAYIALNGCSYFKNLLHREKEEDQRYIGGKGKWHWLASFSPIGTNEVIALHEDTADFGALSDDDLKDLSYGISKVLLCYEEMGHLSFNFTLYSTRSGEKEGLRCLFRIITRQNLYNNYRNDDYFLQKMLQSELIINLPEDLAVKMKGYF